MAGFFRELLSTQLYKKAQGRVVRQWTFAGVLVILCGGLWRLSASLIQQDALVRFGVPALLAVLAVWFCYRLVNYPKFADFLIQVEAEMRKVSWPGRTELINSVLVVIVVMFFLAALLFGYDVLIKWLLGVIGKWGATLFKGMGIFS